MPAYVGLSVQTLARWRHEGKGPEYVKIGRLVAYSVGTVRQWLEQMRRASTSEQTKPSNALRDRY
jgi:predicted DNA-binding transcriptional regulator AlpA